MSSLDFHGWTHRPKAQGGTDPIPLAASGLPVGYMNEGLTSKTISAVTPIEFHHPSWNDDSVFVGLLGITGSSPSKRAKYLEVTPGTYLCHYSINYTSAFLATDLPYILPSVYFPVAATTDTLSNSVTTLSMDGAQGGPDNQLHDQDLNYLSIGTTTVSFSWQVSDFSEDTIGLGMSVVSVNSRTRSLAASMVVIRLGDLTVDKTSFLQTL